MGASKKRKLSGAAAPSPRLRTSQTQTARRLPSSLDALLQGHGAAMPLSVGRGPRLLSALMQFQYEFPFELRKAAKLLRRGFLELEQLGLAFPPLTERLILLNASMPAYPHHVNHLLSTAWEGMGFDELVAFLQAPLSIPNPTVRGGRE